jgi:hypothetical protein
MQYHKPQGQRIGAVLILFGGAGIAWYSAVSGSSFSVLGVDLAGTSARAVSAVLAAGLTPIALAYSFFLATDKPLVSFEDDALVVTRFPLISRVRWDSIVDVSPITTSTAFGARVNSLTITTRDSKRLRLSLGYRETSDSEFHEALVRLWRSHYAG